MPVSELTLTRIRERTSIKEIIEEHVKLKRNGSSWVGLCPFHHEKSGSFNVNPSKGLYYCFGCKEGGDTIQFLAKKNGLTRMEAFRYLADRYGIPWEEVRKDGYAQQAARKRAGELLLMKLANTFYQEQWSSSAAEQAQAYLKGRGVSAALVARFGLGYSPSAWQGLIHHAQSKGYSPEALVKVGLALTKHGRCFDRFRDMITYPFYDIEGHVIAFGARKIAQETQGPKYINSPESDLFQKRKALYGLYQAKEAIRKARHFYLVEGYMDVLAVHSAGLSQVVAVSGTALTQEHARILKKMAPEARLLFDSDPAGYQAALKSLPLLLAQGLAVKVIRLPAGQDPDHYLREQGAGKLCSYLEKHAEDGLAFAWRYLLGARREDPEVQAQAIEKIVAMVAAIPEPVKQAVYLSWVAKQMGIDKKVLEELLAEQKGGPTARPGFRLPGQEVVQQEALFFQERALLYLLLKYGGAQLTETTTLAAYLFEELSEVALRTPVYHRLFNTFKAAWQRDPSLSLERFVQGQSEEIRKAVAELIVEKHSLSQAWEEKYDIFLPKGNTHLGKAAFKTIQRFKLRLVQKLIDENQQALLKANNEQEIQDLVGVHQALKERERQIAQALGMVIAR